MLQLSKSLLIASLILTACSTKINPTKTKDGKDGWIIKCPFSYSSIECESAIGLFCNKGFDVVTYTHPPEAQYIFVCR